MLYLILDDKEYQWHVGEKFPIYSSHMKNIDFVEIQADRDELLFIVENFKNVPFHKTKMSQNWFGDIARFIAAALSVC